MEFLRGLLGGSSAKKTAASDPQQRLARFKQRYGHILHTWQKSHALSTDREAVAHIRRSFQALAAILSDEARSPAPHLCLSFAAGQQIYTAISKIAATSHDEGLVRDAVTVYSALIDSEEEDFLENDVFAASLMNFVGRTIGSGGLGVGEDIEADIVELLFGIAAKIRLQPEILPVWFTTTGGDADGRPANQKTDFAGVTQKEDFPLCYQLIDHVHHEGRIGDFARTGLLYIFESASKSMTLEGWIVNSDLPTLMATGLGALYSQLSRKLSTLHLESEGELPLLLRLSDYAETVPNPQAENFFSADFQSHLETFLSYLRFWQDVLVHCTSAEVRLTLIDHFQILFLQQLLYPSLLESSDVDGGSSVAVLTYLRRVLDVLDHPELVHMILNYLLALPDFDGITPNMPRSPAAIKRRLSLMMDLNKVDADDERMNPTLFNLVDLVLGSTESRDAQTVVAALKLASVILGKHHGYAVGSLIKTMHVHTKEPHRTIGALNAELEQYLNLAISIGGEDGADEAYENHLKDKLSILESHPCSLKTLSLPKTALAFLDTDTDMRSVKPHYLLPEDPLLNSVLDLLVTFLTNDIETNLVLTDVITTLGSCSQLRLEGWLAVDPTTYHHHESSSADPNPSDPDHEATKPLSGQPSRSTPSTPPLLQTLQALQTQIAALRADIPPWDDYIASRKHIFRTYDEVTESAKAIAPTVKPIPEHPSAAWSPQIPKHVIENKNTARGRGSNATSRTASPRGRKEAGAGSEQGRKHASSTSSPAPSKLSGQYAPSGSSSRNMSPLPPLPQPSNTNTFMTDVLGNLASANENPNFKRRIRFRRRVGSRDVEVLLSKYQPPPKEEDEEGDTSAGAVEEEEEEETFEEREASLGHIITNVVVLQEFVLEVVALMQIRASLFNEVRVG